MKLHEEFKLFETMWEDTNTTKLTEGHEVFDLGHGYYADIDEDQYGLYPDAEEIDVTIYKDTSGYQNPTYDKYIKTVSSVEEARAYVNSLYTSSSPANTSSTLKKGSYTVNALDNRIKCDKCDRIITFPIDDIKNTGRTRCPHCNRSLKPFIPVRCAGCGEEHFIGKSQLTNGFRCWRCKAKLNINY